MSDKLFTTEELEESLAEWESCKERTAPTSYIHKRAEQNIIFIRNLIKRLSEL